jgi:pimeloyl-ACP methyl ester carboxylesterase
MLRTLLEDIKPAIDSSYRSNPADTGLAGHSLGGFFTLYALFHAPDVFHHVWSSSPSMIWDHAVLLQHAAALAGHPGVQATVFTSAGREEDSNMTMPLEELNRRMLALHFPGLHWSSEIADHENHSTVELALAQKAMLAIYGQPRRQPTLAEMRKLAGSYRMENGVTVKLLLDGGRLYYAQSDGSYDKTELQTYAPDQWLIRGTQLRLDVQWQENGGPHLIVRRAPSPGPTGDVIPPPMLAVPLDTRKPLHG